jgi:rod shape determining protein RodA
MKALQKLRFQFDWLLFGCIVGLGAIGMLNLYSATSSTDLTLPRQQALWLLVGSIAFVVTALIDYRVFYRLAYPLYGLGLGALVLVLFVGTSVNNSQRWLHFFGLAVQPSEMMKVLLVVALAKYLHDDSVTPGRSLWHVALPFVLVGLPGLLIIEQPDLGTALLLVLLFLSLMLLVKLELRSMILLLIVEVVSLPVAWSYVLRDYQKQRIFTFLEPSSDPSGAGWQSRQSLFAVGSGELTGKGYLRGTQNKLRFLPERWTDFPFAVWAEEWGFLGCVSLIALYLVLILRLIRLASLARDRFGSVVCLGVASLVFWHTIINMAMVTGMGPVVGVTLPLVSYGGSSLLTTMVALGLAMNVSIRRTAF